MFSTKMNGYFGFGTYWLSSRNLSTQSERFRKNLELYSSCASVVSEAYKVRYGTYVKVNKLWGVACHLGRPYICDVTSIGCHWASPTLWCHIHRPDSSKMGDMGFHSTESISLKILIKLPLFCWIWKQSKRNCHLLLG